MKQRFKFYEKVFMTWIVASPTLFGYGVGISDIRVTLPDGSTRDCLQKIYKVGDDIAVGFAGSVRLGFEMVDGLKRFLSDTPNGYAWKPEWVATEWQQFAKQIYSKSAKEEQEARCSLVLIGNIPNETLGDAPLAKTLVAVLRSPDFKPTFVKIGKWDGVGSGMGVNEYKNLIEELNKEIYHPLMPMEVGSPGGWGHIIQVIISQTIDQMPTESVSRFVHLCIVKPREVKITGIDTVEYRQGEKKVYNMPRVATSWEELKEILGASEEALAGSSCTNFFILSEK